MKIRIPGWVRNQVVPSNLYQYSDGKRLGYTVKVNGQEVGAKVTEDGYYTISRKWKKGDKVQIHFDMEPRTVRANNKVEADRGMVSWCIVPSILTTSSTSWAHWLTRTPSLSLARARLPVHPYRRLSPMPKL